MHQIIDETHLEIGVDTGKFNPLADEDLVIVKENPKTQGNQDKQGDKNARNKPW